eukprot:Hpha_TRINITY_DN16695_c6_g5::TRINITY_DN16695_c6_g5_i1::g.182532::m.182532
MWRCVNRWAEVFVTSEDPPEVVRLKRILTPVCSVAVALNVGFLLQNWGRGEYVQVVSSALHFIGPTCLLFAAATNIWNVGAVLDITMLLSLLAVVLNDFGHAATLDTMRAWPQAMLTLDVTLLLGRYHMSKPMLLMMFVYLLVERLEAGWRLGLYSFGMWGVDGGIPPCQCAEPPCAINERALSGIVQVAVIIALDFWCTRRFATGMDEQLRAVKSSVAVSAEVAAALARYDVDVAEGAITSGEHLPDELVESYRLLLHNLLLYRPYLPAALFAPSQHSPQSDMSSDPFPLVSPDTFIPNIVECDVKDPSGSNSTGHPRLDSMSALEVKPRRCTLMQAVTEVADGEDTCYLSSFVSTVLSAAQAHKGVLLLLGGEQMTVGWNTHVPLATHTYNGMVCGMSVKNRIPQPSQRTGIAVCCGSAFTGSAGRVDAQIAPVVVGPLFSLSVQLAHLAPLINVECLCCEGAYEKTRGEIVARVVDVVRMDQGKQDVFVYQVLARRSYPGLCEEFKAVVDQDAIARHTGAFSAIRQLHWRQAQDLLSQQVALYPDDFQALRLLRLCSLFATAPPLDPLGRPMDHYVRYFSRWTWYEAMGEEGGMECSLSSRSFAFNQPATSEILEADDEEDETDAIRDAIRSIRMGSSLQSHESGGLHGSRRVNPSATVRELVDTKGRAYVRGNKALGRGAFGEVFLGMSVSGGLVALKFVFLPSVTEPGSPVAVSSGCFFPVSTTDSATMGDVAALLKEVSLMCNLRHDNIVSYLGSAVVPQNLVLILEYVPGGSLRNVMTQFDRRIPLTSVQRYISDTISGLEYLHGQGVVHRDLKPHNVLVAADGTGKVADFGASEEIQKLATVLRRPGAGAIGTPLYMAPEQCMGKTQPASDIWSLGIMAAELISGELPWPPGTQGGIQFVMEMHDETSALAPNFSRVREVGGQLAYQFCEDCCRRNPEDRPQPRALVSHAFMMMSIVFSASPLPPKPASTELSLATQAVSREIVQPSDGTKQRSWSWES